ncbi:MAG: flagellar motor protein MotB [Desulfopila sp.]
MTANIFNQQPPAEKTQHYAGFHEAARQRSPAEQRLNSVAPQLHNAFPMHDSTLRPTEARKTHWSTAWSDLMMTMFILFLSLFVYQAAHKDFFTEHNREVRGIVAQAADNTAGSDIGSNTAALPFTIIKSVPPRNTGNTTAGNTTAGNTTKRAEAITLQNVSPETTFSGVNIQQSFEQLAQDLSKAASTTDTGTYSPRKSRAGGKYPAEKDVAKEKIDQTSSPPQTLFDRSLETVKTNNLGELASIDLLPNKAVRIVLTSDLLFATGQAELSRAASRSLQKIAAVVSDAPHQIHVEGHTDDVPIKAGRYANNWELSVARANAVAMFLIEDMEMNPDQFVISGYSSYKPVASNNDGAGRAQNRRVEIVVSQPPEQPAIATVDRFSKTMQTL